MSGISHHLNAYRSCAHVSIEYYNTHQDKLLLSICHFVISTYCGHNVLKDNHKAYVEVLEWVSDMQTNRV